METINKKRQTDEIRRCVRDPIYFFKTYVKVSHPTKGPVNFDTFDFQDECVKAFLEHRYVIVNKSRQLGLSTLSAAYAAWLLIFHRNKEVIIMATKLKVAMNFIRKVKFCVQNLPKWLVLPKIVEDNKQSLVFGFPSHSRIEAIPTAADAGRSEALSLLIVDEAAHVPDFEELWKGLYPTLSCVVGDTKVLMDDGFHDIEEFCRGHEIGDYFELKGQIFGKDGLEPLSHGYVSPESETLKITTTHGIEIETTLKHPLWALNHKEGGSMVKAQDLRVGDYLRVQHSMEIYGNDNSLDHPVVKELTPELAYLVGGWIAEGWISKGYNVSVSNVDQEFRQAYLKNEIIKPFVEAQNNKLICYSKQMVELFELIGCKREWKCDTKRVPSKIWRCSKDVQAAFLRGYFDGDGCCGKDGKVAACSTSHKLLLDVQQLMLNMGFIPSVVEQDYEKLKTVIGTFIGKNKNPVKSVRRAWSISIPRTQAKKFLDNIGFAIQRKRERLENVDYKDDDQNYIIPKQSGLGGRIRMIGRESGLSLSWFGSHNVSLGTFNDDLADDTRGYTFKTLRSFRDLLVAENRVSERNLSFLNEVCQGNFTWDKIESIEVSHGKTYDFTVPKSHSFLQNSILGSNTGGRALIISTPKGVGNWFHKLWVDAQDGSNEFHPIELPWTVHPERDDEWYRQQTANMSAKAIAQELMCDFLSSGDTYLDSSDIDWIGKSIKKPVKRDGPDGNVWIWEDPIRDHEFKYVIPADVGRGDGNDFSTFHVLCMASGEVVAEFRGKIRPDLFAKLLLEYGKRYNNALICPERNTYGHHVIIELVNSGYSNIYFKNQKGVYIGDYIPADRISDAGFDTQKESRKQIIAKLEEVIRNRQIKVYSARLHSELKTFVTHGDKPQAQKNCHDDLVLSLAIGVWLFDASAVHSQFANNLNRAMLAGFGMNANKFDNLEGNGRDVLPAWTGMVPYMGNANMPQVNQRRQRPKRDDPTNIDWLWK